MKNRLILLFVLALCCNSIFAGEYEYGLKIITYPSAPDMFTSLSLNDGKIIQAKRSPVTMSFEIMNRHENVFGCIFRIITDKGYNVDMMYTADREDRRYPILVCGAEVNDVPTMIEFDKWIPVSITLNPKTGDITFNYGGKCILVNDENIKGSVGYRISFGHCRFSGYSLDDVASVNIREIQILRGSRTIRHWPLSCHDGDYCTDDIDASPAIAVNPEWMLDQYITWDRILTREYHGEPSLAYDNEDGLFITTDGRWMDVYGGTIYATSGGFVKEQPWGVTTRKGNTLYVHVLNHQDSITIPVKDNRLVSAVEYASGAKVPVKQSRDAVVVTVPEGNASSPDTVIELTFRKAL